MLWNRYDSIPLYTLGYFSREFLYDDKYETFNPLLILSFIISYAVWFTKHFMFNNLFVSYISPYYKTIRFHSLSKYSSSTGSYNIKENLERSFTNKNWEYVWIFKSTQKDILFISFYNNTYMLYTFVYRHTGKKTQAYKKTHMHKCTALVSIKYVKVEVCKYIHT